MTKHTPWTVDVDDLSGSLLVIDYGSATVAEVFDRRRVDIANIIAAAPELLKALEAVIGGKCPECNGWGEVAYFGEMVECKCHGNYRHTPTDEQIKNARAAIAKAKGE